MKTKAIAKATARRVSDVLGVSTSTLETLGVFNGFVDLDSSFYIDPHLLDSSTAPEFSTARACFEKHFGQVFKLLSFAEDEKDPLWKQAVARLTFQEIPNTGLGVASRSKEGSGIGPGLAAELTALAKRIAEAGFKDPEIFELVGLLQDKIGPDRISDMTAAIVLPNILDYSARIAKALKATCTTFDSAGKTYDVPLDALSTKALFLVPADVLRHIPVAMSWDEVDIVAAHNAALRQKVNGIIGETWKKATTKVKKKTLRDTVLEHPELLEELIELYQAKASGAYDFVKDPEALIVWQQHSAQLAATYPLPLTKGAPTFAHAKSVVTAICWRFRELVEQNRMTRLLHDDDGTPRSEKISQLAFYMLADSYCRANDLDLSPEVDAGAGPVDFKFSSGSSVKVLVEIKLSSNTKLRHSFEKQLPAYAKAESSQHNILLIVRTTASEKSINQVLALAKKAKDTGKKVPQIVVIDGRLKPSASNL